MTQGKKDKNIREQYIRAIQATVVYQVGELIVDARSSWKNALALPWRLYRLHRFDRMVVREGQGKSTASLERQILTSSGPENLLTLDLIDAQTGDLSALKQRLDQSRLAPSNRADAVLRAASLLVSSRPDVASTLAHLALETDASEPTLEQAAFLLYRVGHLVEPARLLENLVRTSRPALRGKIIEEAKMLAHGFALPTPSISKLKARAPRLLYVSHLSLPHHTSGYATRTHGILSALQRSGHDAICVTRPGYPWDRFDSRAIEQFAPVQEIEGVRYLHLPGPSASQTPFPDFAAAAADALVETVEQQKPSCIVAGSNYVNALPALMAARRTGLPIYYDIRGLWEFTSAAKTSGWQRSERFHLARQMESLIAAEADGVFAISTPLKEELINRGVPAEKITLLPNSVDCTRFRTDAYDPNLRASLGIPSSGTVFGFIGSMETYEGLDQLIRAFARLVAADVDAWLVLVGDGPEARHVGDLVGALGVVPRVRFVGRVPFTDVVRYYRMCDIFVYPRTDSPLTRLVPALKPLEAMAAGKPVIVSDLPALVELVGGSGNVCLTPPGDSDMLAEHMEVLARDVTQRTRLAEAGHRHAQVRSWETTVSSMMRILFAPPFPGMEID